MASNESTASTKTCTKCGIEKSLTAFEKQEGKGYKPGHRRSQCSQCRRLARADKRRAEFRTWSLKNRVQRTHAQRNRHSMTFGSPVTFTYEQEQFCRQYFQYTCVYCGKEEGFFWYLSMDHFIPLSSPACPGTVVTNMLPACNGRNGCNISKKNHDPHAWLIRKFGKRQAAAILKRIHAYFAIVRLRSLPE